MFDYFCNSIIGHSHIKKGTPKEDFGAIQKYDDCLIFVLGDGHGDPTCFRSQIGSEMICNIAIETLKSFCDTVKENDREKELFVKRTSQNMIRQLVSVIFGTWKKKTVEHLKENPYTEDEISFMDSKREIGSNTILAYDQGIGLEHIYGTTFIAGALTDKYLLLLHQGDGKCSVMYADGEYDEPVPWDDRCFSNVCTSVCDVDSIESCRYAIIKLDENPVIACIISSDGVEDSFAEDMDLVHSYYDEILLYGSENGKEALERHLEETLPEMTKNGSNDDITICGFYYTDQIQAFKDKFEVRAEFNSIQAALVDINRRIKSAEGSPKMIALEKNLKKSTEQLEAIKSEYDALAEERRTVKSDLEKLTVEDDAKGTDLISRIKSLLDKGLESRYIKDCISKCQETLKRFDEVEEKYKKAQERYDEDKKAYDEYMERYYGFLSKREELLQKLSELKRVD